MARRVLSRVGILSRLPFSDLRSFRLADLRGELPAALTVTFMAIPQGVAYALIAGLPPAMGLYAGFLPAIFGSLFRSSRHVITGPTNALSLLVGSAAAGAADVDPVAAAMLLALIVGSIQFLAGVVRLGSIVDFISMPVVVGYITGAGVLIGVGQLPNLTETAGASGTIVDKLVGWGEHATGASALAVGVGVAVAATILALRRWNRALPSSLIALALATASSWALDLGGRGLRRVADLASVPAGLPPLSVPDLEGWTALVPLAIAATVLSLVESSAVARALAARTGQRLDLSFEFIGQGLANIAAGLSGGYPTSGSLSRSALNHGSGARTRIAGVASGLAVGASLLFLGPIVDYTPIAALAGLLLVVAVDLVDVPRIASIVRGRPSDALAFAVTVVGTWALPLDKAIYLGVGITVLFFLRRARVLTITPLVVTGDGAVSLAEGDEDPALRVLQVDGQLFFAGVSDLAAALDEALADPRMRVTIVRLRRALGIDVTAASALAELADRFRDDGRRLILVGLDEGARVLFERSGALSHIGLANVYGRSRTLFGSLRRAVQEARPSLEGESPTDG